MRVGYRLAYLGLSVYWRILRPHERGAQLVILNDNAIVLVRHSYRESSTWMLPGGRVSHDEAPRTAAAREAAEELGLSVDRLFEVARRRTNREGKRNELIAFLARLPAREDVSMDRVELIEARWFDLNGLPEEVSEETTFVLDRVRRYAAGRRRRGAAARAGKR